MKKDYLSPEIKTVGFSDLMQGPVIPLGSPTDDFPAKEQGEVEEDDEPDLAAPIKDKWEDMSEKKNGK